MEVINMTMSQFEAAIKGGARVAVLPLGSTEEHGRHLPLDTDTMQAHHTARLAAARTPFFILPPLHYGYCRSTRNHPGTIGITPQTLRAMVGELGHSLYGQGVRGLVLLSGHAGKSHMAMLEEAAQDMVDSLDGFEAAVVCEYHWAQAGGKSGIVETIDDGHAGEIETSRILALDPSLVKGTSPEEYPNFPAPFVEREKRKAWPGGVWGDPGKATAEKGEKLYGYCAEKLAALVRQMEARLAARDT